MATLVRLMEIGASTVLGQPAQQSAMEEPRPGTEPVITQPLNLGEMNVLETPRNLESATLIPAKVLKLRLMFSRETYCLLLIFSENNYSKVCRFLKNYSSQSWCFHIQNLSGCEPTKKTIRMESWGFAYAEKAMKVSSMTVNNRQSSSACTMGHSFGFDGEKVWVNHGCRADFDVTVEDCD